VCTTLKADAYTGLALSTTATHIRIMDKAAAALLEALAQSCASHGIRPEHWRRLYDFTIYVHLHGQGPAPRVIKEFLIHRGCSIQKASWLSTECRHFLELLAQYDARKRV
jgi:hypothetical protein